eukprot:TRINITY_DN25023_c0_g1_i1.p1 TRINITY_DN25023_c0_g1~~TRINITY_DN25023_c0_g1_i1.p1  ORF type:complete len:270 (+),score=22.56 TRINITY_DN25023_c0_g1_i1:45-854(+)
MSIDLPFNAWCSPSRVQFCLYGGYFIGVTTWIVSYLLWLSQGCRPFLPFISDFHGGQSEPFFTWGMTICAILLIPSWIDYYHASKRGLQTNYRRWRFCHMLVLCLGILISISIIGVALNPWHERVDLHMYAAYGVFFSGSAWMVVDSLLWYVRGRSFKRFSSLAMVALVSMAMGSVYSTRGWDNLRRNEEKASLEMLGSDFLGYCQGGEGSLHKEWYINATALCEWLLVGSAIITTAVKMHLELQSWPQKPSPSQVSLAGSNDVELSGC